MNMKQKLILKLQRIKHGLLYFILRRFKTSVVFGWDFETHGFKGTPTKSAVFLGDNRLEEKGFEIG